MSETHNQQQGPIFGGLPDPDHKFKPGIRQMFDHWNFRRRKECRTVIRWLDGRPGERILDIGCGDGYYDALISNTEAHVVGIDLHAERLATANSAYTNRRTEYHSIDAERMEFEDASFDKALSLCVIEHLEDDELVMRNVARALKPGGLFVFSADSLTIPGITPEERAHHRRKYAVNTFYTVAIVRDKLARAGFDIVETRYILSTPRDLGFVSLSWKLDRLPVMLRFLRPASYAALGSARKVAAWTSAPPAGSAECGLTLLVKARKRPPA